MKIRISYFALFIALTFTLASCKSKQEGIQDSYERANSKPSVYVIEEMDAVEKPKPAAEVVQKEKLTTISGPQINSFSVVIGSFVNKTNATSLKERMEREGYTPSLAQNEKGMYRLILSTFKEEARARDFRDTIIRKYSPEFFDTWVLEQEK